MKTNSLVAYAINETSLTFRAQNYVKEKSNEEISE